MMYHAIADVMTLATNSTASWGQMGYNTVVSLIMMLAFSGAVVAYAMILTYVLSGFEQFSMYNPAISFFIFVMATGIAISAPHIMDLVLSKANLQSMGQDIFGYLFGKNLGKDLVEPLVKTAAYWVLIISALILALPNGIAAMTELARFQIGRMNAAGPITALAIVSVFVVGLPTLHGQIQSIVSLMPDLIKTITDMLNV